MYFKVVLMLKLIEEDRFIYTPFRTLVWDHKDLDDAIESTKYLWAEEIIQDIYGNGKTVELIHEQYKKAVTERINEYCARIKCEPLIFNQHGYIEITEIDAEAEIGRYWNTSKTNFEKLMIIFGSRDIETKIVMPMVDPSCIKGNENAFKTF